MFSTAQVLHSSFRDLEFRDLEFRDPEFRDPEFRDPEFRDPEFRDPGVLLWIAGRRVLYCLPDSRAAGLFASPEKGRW
jgi:hypothetical protein